MSRVEHRDNSLILPPRIRKLLLKPSALLFQMARSLDHIFLAPDGRYEPGAFLERAHLTGDLVEQGACTFAG